METSTIVLSVICIVLIWRGLWGLADTYITPNNEELSYWLSLFIGVGVLIYVDKLWVLTGRD